MSGMVYQVARLANDISESGSDIISSLDRETEF